jgi:anti-anti-sigma factor
MGEQLQTSVDVGDDGIATLRVAGEIDLAVAHDLGWAVEKVCASQPKELVIDLSEVSYCDSSGLGQFVLAAQLCKNDGIGCRIVRAAPIVQRVFEIAGLSEMLDPGRD